MAAIPSYMQSFVEWGEQSLDVFISTRTRLQQKGRRLCNTAHLRWEVAAAKAVDTYHNAQDTCTDALTSISEFTLNLTTATTTASAQVQAWAPAFFGVLLFGLTMLAIYKIHVATDGAILTWLIKMAIFLRPRLLKTLHCLLILSFEVVGFVLVHGTDYLVVPTILLLARIGVQLFIYFFCTWTTPVFSPNIKAREEEEKENKTRAAAGSFFSLWYMGELKPLSIILLGLGYIAIGYIMLFALSMIETWGLAVVSGNAGEQGADVASPTHKTNSNTTTATTANETMTATAMALETERLSFGTRVLRFIALKKTTDTPRRPLGLRNPFKSMPSMRRHARLSSAATTERPTATASDANLDDNRIRSESGLGAWMRRASQGAAKEGGAAMVAAGCGGFW